MYDALLIALYIIHYTNETKHYVSNLKLQKLLYLCQAHFLLTVRKPCFKDEIVAWDFGPVVISTYREFKRFSAGWIPPIKRWFEHPDPDNPYMNMKERTFTEDLLDKKTRKLVREVVEQFKDYTSTDMLTLVHHQQPWIDAFRSYDKIITNESLVAYFSKEDDTKTKFRPGSPTD